MNSNAQSEQKLMGFDPRLLCVEGFASSETDLVVGASTDQRRRTHNCAIAYGVPERRQCL